MKRIFIFVFAAVAALAVASCNKDMPGKDALEEQVPVEFTLDGEITATVDTRATEVSTTTLSSMNVTATTGSSEQQVNNFSNVSFTKSNNVWRGGKYWPASNPSYHFYAANMSMTHTTNGQTVSPTNANTDVVVGYLASPTYKQSNALTMNHIFAQIGTTTITAPSGFTVTDLKVSVAPKTGGTYNLKSGTWTAKGNAGSAQYLVGTSNSGASISTAGGSTNGGDKDLWLVPDTYTLTVSYKLVAGDVSSDTINKTASVTIAQGKNNNISATLPADGAPTEIEFTVTVTAWENQNQGVTWN